MKPLKKEFRFRVSPGRLSEVAENLKGWLWLPWVLGRVWQGQGLLGGIHRTGPGGWGDTRMEVKIMGDWGTGQGIPHASGMVDKVASLEGREGAQRTWALGLRM